MVYSVLEPCMPHDEIIRQSTLDSLNILDIPPVEQLDRVTRLAAGYFKVTTALVSLIDENRLCWTTYLFKKRICAWNTLPH